MRGYFHIFGIWGLAVQMGQDFLREIPRHGSCFSLKNHYSNGSIFQNFEKFVFFVAISLKMGNFGENYPWIWVCDLSLLRHTPAKLNLSIPSPQPITDHFCMKQVQKDFLSFFGQQHQVAQQYADGDTAWVDQIMNTHK